MDRNEPSTTRRLTNLVALRKESVDRNYIILQRIHIVNKSLSARRAWIEILGWYFVAYSRLSLSARRAWIEINGVLLASVSSSVALRKESVDRNLFVGLLRTFTSLSLSARRAWIEISTRNQPNRSRRSLSARRAWIEIQTPRLCGL